MRFLASSRHQHRGFARHDGFHATAAVRPQVFATSRRFAPRSTSRACFIPLARPGFALQGVPLVRSRYDSSPQRCPLVVTAPTPPLAKRPRRNPTSGPCSPQESVAAGPQLSSPNARSPPELFPLQGLPHLGVGTCFHAPPLSSLPAHPYGTSAQVLLRVFRHRRMGSSLARRPALTEVLWPFRSLERSRAPRTGLIVSPRRRRRVAATPALLLDPFVEIGRAHV